MTLLSRLWFPAALALLLLLCVPVLVLVVLHLFGADGAINEWLGDNFQLSYEFPLPWILGLLFLLVPPAIVLLYFLKLKRKPLQVPSTFLWRKSIEDLHVNSLFQWLRENILLLLQLLTALLLLYAVMGFLFHGSTAKGQHYILLIDNSASMAATDVKPSRLEWAKGEALKVIDAATEESVGMVIEFNERATTLQAYTSNKAKLREAVNGIKQSHRPTRILDALMLADSLANQRRSTEDVASRPDNVEPGQERQYAQAKGIPTDLYLFSDARFPDPPKDALGGHLGSLLSGNTSALRNLKPHFHPAGKQGAENVSNVGIVQFSAARLVEEQGARPARESLDLRVLVQVQNYCATPQVVKVRLAATSDGKPGEVLEKLIDLPARKFIPGDPEKDVPGVDEPGAAAAAFDLQPLDQRATTVLQAWLDGVRDDFTLDDQAWLVIGVVRKARVLVVTPGNPVLDAFFNQEATKRLATVTRLAPADLATDRYREAAQGGEYDLVIFDRCVPAMAKDMPQANTLCIDNPPPPWQRGGRALKNPFLIITNKDHPLLRHLTTLWEVGVTDAFRFNLAENLPEAERGQFNLDGKEPGKKALPPLTRLIEAGGDVPLLFTLPRGDYTDVVMAFPLLGAKGELTTNWPLQPSFPLFLRNVLLVLGNVREGMREGAVRPGEPMVLRPEAGVDWVEVTPPGGKPEKLTRGRRPDFIYAATERVGLYDVRRSDKVHHPFAVNLLDPLESNLQPRPRFQVGEDTVSADRERSQPRALWKWLALAALGLLMLEWYVYNHRVRV